ncbi:oligosaccharide flippase family protein [Castellaniella sp.]|uniref:oligosaccharide flippase family protein n=1 Tax=Castellaniella sp. TaxID=1955812 RepID=UPI00355DDC05
MIPAGSSLYTLIRTRALRSLLWLASEKVVQLAFSALAVGLVARTLGTDAFGIFQYVLSAMMVFSSIGLIASTEVSAPRLATCEQPQERRRLLGSLFVLRLMAGTLAFLLMGTWSLYMEPLQRQPLMLIMGLALIVIEPFNVLRLIREVAQSTRIITVTRLLVSSLKVIAVAVLYTMHAPILAFIIVYAADHLLTALCYLFGIREDGWPCSWRPTREVMGWFFHKGLLIWLGLVALILILRMDRLILHARLDAGLYGQYAAAMNLLDSAWYFGPVSVVALAPSLLYRAGRQTLWSSLRLLLILTALALLIMVGAGLLAPFIVSLIFGAGFEQTAGMFQLALVVLVPGFAALGLDAILIHAGNHRVVPLKWGVGLAAGAMLLVPDFGLGWHQGPLALGVAHTVSLLAGLWFLWRMHLGRPAAAAGGPVP